MEEYSYPMPVIPHLTFARWEKEESVTGVVGKGFIVRSWLTVGMQTIVVAILA